MLITPWLRSMKSVLDPQSRKSAVRRGRSLRSAVEHLPTEVERMEDRTLLSVASFNNGVVRIEDPAGLDTDPGTVADDDDIDLQIRFDMTPTHGMGLFLSVKDTTNGITTTDPEFFAVAGGKELLIPLDDVHCVNVLSGEGDDTVDATAGGTDFGFFIQVKMKGGEGKDMLIGGLNRDHFEGGDGDDMAVGREGNDVLLGGGGEDMLIGGDGDDRLEGGADDDVLDGGDSKAAADVVAAGLTADTTGDIDDGDDTVWGGAGNDLLIAGTSNVNTNSNEVLGGAGRDTLVATDYNPIFFFADDSERAIKVDITRGSNPGIPDVLRIDGTTKDADGDFDLVSQNPGGMFDSDRDGLDDLDPDGAGPMPDPDATTEPWSVSPTRTNFEEVEEAWIVQAKDSAMMLQGNLSANDVNIEQFDEIGMALVNSAGGDDTVNTGDNSDTINGGDGNDVLNGNAGDDSINGNKGDDKLFGGEGNDTLQGGTGSDDSVFGQGGDDIIYAREHDGIAHDGVVNPLLDIDPMDEFLIDPDFDATPRMFPDRDREIDEIAIPGFPVVSMDDSVDGNNLLDGGEGADIIFGGRQRDTLFGGPGGRSEYRDVPSLSETTTGEDVVETYILRDYDLIFTGTEYVYSLSTLHGPAGDDTIGDLVGDHHFSNLRPTNEDGGAGADLIFGTDEQDDIHAGGGHDTVVGGDETSPGDKIEGGVGRDYLLGGDGEDTIRGNAGDDTINGGDGHDCLRGHDGDDSIDGGKGNDAISGNDGNDTLLGGVRYADDNAILKESGDDDLTGGRGNDFLDGEDGKDTLHGGTGADTLVAGQERIPVADDLDGGADFDIVLFEQKPTAGVGVDVTLTPTTLTNNFNGTVDTLTGIDGAFFDGTGNATEFSHKWDGATFTGSQTLIGGDGKDSLRGGTGNDLIIGGTDDKGAGAADSLRGEGGDDLIFAGYAALLVNDDSEVVNDRLTPVPETEIALSDIDLQPALVKTGIVLSGGPGGTARLVGDPFNGGVVNLDVVKDAIGELFSDEADIAKISAEEKANDLHILVLDKTTEVVETIVKIEGGMNGLTGVFVSAVQPNDGSVDFDDAGKDTAQGAAGDDVLIGSVGMDSIDGGGKSDDLIVGGDGDDCLNGNAGDDTLFGLEGDDELNGNMDNDVLNGGEGKDTLNGGDDDDTLTGGPNDDTLRGDGGTDTILEVANIHADLDNGMLAATTDGFGFGVDAIPAMDIEEAFLIGGDDDNDLDASDWSKGPVTLVGLAGDDTLEGSASKSNVLDAGSGDDTIIGGDDVDLIHGGAGNDTVEAGDEDDAVHGGPGDDSIDAGDGEDTVYGGLGNDTIYGDESAAMDGDILAGGPGHDLILGGSVADNDTDDADDYLYGDGRELFAPGTTIVPAFEVTTNAPDGNDTLDAGHGRDGLSGGDGNDVLVGGLEFGPDDRDTLYGGSGNDTLFGGGDSDILIGGAGNDTLDSETGAADTVDMAAGDLIVPRPGDVDMTTPGPNTFLNDILWEPDEGEAFLSASKYGLNWLDAV